VICGNEIYILIDEEMEGHDLHPERKSSNARSERTKKNKLRGYLHREH